MKINNIALVAHDSRKKELLEWVTYNKDELKKYHLFATGTTGRLIEELRVEDIESNEPNTYRVEYPFTDNVVKLLSGPLGGDQQIGAMIATGQIDMLIFFCDNLVMQGHQNDVSALTRLASLYNIPFATNRTTADLILTSALLTNDEYEPKRPSFNNYINRQL